MLNDWLEPESLLIDRLKKEVGPWVRDVLGARELASIGEAQQPSPALHVIYQGEQPSTAEGGHGAARIVTQQWLVVLAVESARDLTNGAGERITVGQLMSKVIVALSGHQLDGSINYRPIRRQPAPAPAFMPPWAYYPLLFDVMFAGA